MREKLRQLTGDTAIYGAGDVAVTAVNFLLLPLYLLYLSPADQGAIGLLIAVETFAKIIFRWGLDGAFMRAYYDQPEETARRRVASSIFWFMAAANGALLAAALIMSAPLARMLFGDRDYLTPLRLVLVNTFLISFTFLPFHLMRMRQQAITFSKFSFGRSAATLVLRFAWIVYAGWGVTGLAVADLAVTLVVVPLLLPWFLDLVGPTFSMRDLRAALRFGLPRLPHGVAQQALDAGNTLLLNRFLPLDALGVYRIGVTIGQSLKFFLSAFEYAWQPFYYATSKQPDAPVVFSKMTTYGVALLVVLAAGAAALAPDVIRLLTTPAYAGAAAIVPLIALGVVAQGVYLLTSIGLNLTGRTEFYPASTFVAAAVGIGSGLLLMPAWGAIGAAISYTLSYATLAAVALYFSQRVYPVSYEPARLGRVLLAGLVAAAAGLALPIATPAVAIAMRGSITVIAFVVVLWMTGFLRASERRLLAELAGRWMRDRGATPGP